MDIEHVLNGRSWSFDKNLICIQEFDSNTPPSEMNFTHEPFWIQLHGMPLAAMTFEARQRIGSTIGEVMTVDVVGEGVGWGKYLRVRVSMDISKPLAQGRLIRIEGKQRWIEFKYDRLPLFYF